LSELAGEFEVGLARLRRDVPMADLATVEQRLLAQTLLGVLPPAGGGHGNLRERLHAYFEKALREAKQRSSWTRPDEQHEAAVRSVVDLCLADAGTRVRAAFGDLVERVAYHGMLNSLVLTLLRVAGPGVVDTYQGTELLDLSLVDPDNRRPVDYTRRRRALESLRHSTVGALRERWSDGDLKLLVLTRALEARRAEPELFVGGDYIPLRSADERFVAFARRHDGRWVLALASRFTTRGTVGASVPLPAGAPARWRDAITGGTVEASRGELTSDEVFAELPVALLTPVD